jgi:antitoxin HicB
MDSLKSLKKHQVKNLRRLKKERKIYKGSGRNEYKTKNLGSHFDDFLKQEGLLEETEAVAIKRVIAFQLEKTMKHHHLTKTMMAKKMNTSRSALDRLFDPGNDSVTLVTLNKAASALGRRLKVELV